MPEIGEGKREEGGGEREKGGGKEKGYEQGKIRARENTNEGGYDRGYKRRMDQVPGEERGEGRL